MIKIEWKSDDQLKYDDIKHISIFKWIFGLSECLHSTKIDNLVQKLLLSSPKSHKINSKINWFIQKSIEKCRINYNYLNWLVHMPGDDEIQFLDDFRSYDKYHDKCIYIIDFFKNCNKEPVFRKFKETNIYEQTEIFESFHPLYAHPTCNQPMVNNDEDCAKFIFSIIYIFKYSKQFFDDEIGTCLVNLFIKLEYKELYDELKDFDFDVNFEPDDLDTIFQLVISSI